MNYVFYCLLFVASYLICSLFLRAKWKFYDESWPFSRIDQLRRYNALSRIWPCDNNFTSLRWSAVRHTAIPLIFSFIVWFVNVSWLHSILLFLCLAYIWIPLSTYRVRRKDYSISGKASQELLRPVKAACFSIVILAIANYLILMACYAFRP